MMSLAHPGVSPEAEEERVEGFFAPHLLRADCPEYRLADSETASLQGSSVPWQSKGEACLYSVLSAPPKMHKCVLHRLIPVAMLFGIERSGERRKERGG